MVQYSQVLPSSVLTQTVLYFVSSEQTHFTPKITPTTADDSSVVVLLGDITTVQGIEAAGGRALRGGLRTDGPAGSHMGRRGWRNQQHRNYEAAVIFGACERTCGCGDGGLFASTVRLSNVY